MCLGIPGQIKVFSDVHEHLARVDVSGVTRVVNIGLLEDEHLKVGDWVLIHVGFAMLEDRRGRGRSDVGLTEADGSGLRGRARGVVVVEELQRIRRSVRWAPSSQLRVGRRNAP